jgi:Txe/YoeB family toxin of toxin-antitoxin system
MRFWFLLRTGVGFRKRLSCFPFQACESPSGRAWRSPWSPARRSWIGDPATLYQYAKQAQKDAQELASSDLKEKARELLRIVEGNPYQNPLPYEMLVGDLAGAYSRRINIQHRLVY